MHNTAPAAWVEVGGRFENMASQLLSNSVNQQMLILQNLPQQPCLAFGFLPCSFIMVILFSSEVSCGDTRYLGDWAVAILEDVNE